MIDFREISGSSLMMCKKSELKDKIKWIKQATRIIKAYETIQATNPSATLMLEWSLQSGVT